MAMPNTPFSAQPPEAQESLSWLDLWGYAITSPSKHTFEEILADPKAEKTPFIWIMTATVIGFLITMVGQLLFGASILSTEMSGDFAQSYSTSPFWSLLCGVPAAVVGGLLGFYISFGLQHIIVKLFGGKGTWHEYAFAVAAFYVPLIVIGPMIAFIPLVFAGSGILGMLLGYIPTLLLSIYTLILNINAMRAAHQVGTGKAFLVIVVIPLVIGGIFACLIGYLLAQLGMNVMDYLNTSGYGLSF